jgi:hypothetical protein
MQQQQSQACNRARAYHRQSLIHQQHNRLLRTLKKVRALQKVRALTPAYHHPSCCLHHAHVQVPVPVPIPACHHQRMIQRQIHHLLARLR